MQAIGAVAGIQGLLVLRLSLLVLLGLLAAGLPPARHGPEHRADPCSLAGIVIHDLANEGAPGRTADRPSDALAAADGGTRLLRGQPLFTRYNASGQQTSAWRNIASPGTPGRTRPDAIIQTDDGHVFAFIESVPLGTLAMFLHLMRISIPTWPCRSDHGASRPGPRE